MPEAEMHRYDRVADPPPPLTGLAREIEDSPDLLNLRVARHWWVMALRGVLAIALGVLALAWPAVTLLTLVLFFAVYCVLYAIFSATLAVRGARHGGRWLLLAFNAALALAAQPPYVTRRGHRVPSGRAGIRRSQ